MDHYRLEPLPAKSPEIGLLLSVLEDSTREWTGDFDDATDDLVNFRAVDGEHCFGGVMLHIMAAERYWVDSVILNIAIDKADPAMVYDNLLDQNENDWPDAPTESLEWYFDLFKKHRARTIELLSEIEDAHKIVQKHDRSDYSISWIIGHLIQHDSYHGGQIVMLNQFHKKVKKLNS